MQGDSGEKAAYELQLADAGLVGLVAGIVIPYLRSSVQPQPRAQLRAPFRLSDNFYCIHQGSQWAIEIRVVSG